MNVSNILKVADAIENSTVQNLGFNMGGYMGTVNDAFPDTSGRGCGTAACIVGWTVATEHNSIVGYPSQEEARQLLGLTDADARLLFFPDGFGCDIHKPSQAVRCLRNLAITGKVDWEAAMKDDEPILPQRPAISPTARLDRLALKLNQ